MMSSPARGHDPDPGPTESDTGNASTPNKQSQHKKPDKRPGPHKHHSSWTARLHRKHDAKHHPRETEPLLADDRHADDEAEAEDDQPAPPQPCWQQLLAGARQASNTVKRTTEKAMSAVAEGGKKTKSAGISGATQAKKGLCDAAQKSKDALKNNPKKSVGALVFLLIAAIAVLATLLGLASTGPPPVSFCTTSTCVAAASSILSNLDPSVRSNSSGLLSLDFASMAVNPCSDFDKFVCGGFEKRHHLRPDQGDMSTGTNMVENVEHNLHKTLHLSLSDVPSKSKAVVKMLKSAFDACMDESTIKKKGLKPLKEVTEMIKELLPAADVVLPTGRSRQHSYMHRQSPHALTAALTYLLQIDVPALLAFNVAPDDKDPSKQTVFASPINEIGLPNAKLYKDVKTMPRYRAVVRDTLQSFFDFSGNSTAYWNNGHRMRTTPADLAVSVVDLEKELANALPAREEQTDPEKAYNVVSLDDFSKLLPQISVRKLFRNLARSVELDHIIVSSPQYMERLSHILNATQPDTLQGFLAWKAIQKLANRVDDPALSSLKEFEASLSGASLSKPAERWRRCVQNTNRDLSWAASFMFVDKAFASASKTAAEKIVASVLETFTKVFENISWMAMKDLKAASEKAKAIKAKIGYPDKHPDLRDPTSVEKYYEGLAITDDLYFQNAINVAKFDVEHQWSKLGKPTNPDEWGMSSTTVNAYYSPTQNTIFFPAAILQKPLFYDAAVPSYLSYGSFGAVAAHEMSHAFDTIGSHYTADGKLQHWWSKDTTQAFDKKAQCFVDQYDSYSVEGPDGPRSVSGKLTLAENIADAGGLNTAYHAWKAQEKKHVSQTLPGLEGFSKDQVFFLAYGNWWCSKTTKEKAAAKLLTDSHAPKPIKIKGTVANSKEFLQAFKCPNKEPKCELW